MAGCHHDMTAWQCGGSATEWRKCLQGKDLGRGGEAAECCFENTLMGVYKKRAKKRGMLQVFVGQRVMGFCGELLIYGTAFVTTNGRGAEPPPETR